MADTIPPPVQRLLDARDETSRESAWDAFLEAYGRLLLHAAHSVFDDHDGAMDGYARILESLRDDDLRRLRAYGVRPQARFTTWLAAVARRVCLDDRRRRVGRPRDREYGRSIRRQLDRLGGLDPALLGDQSDVTGQPDQAIRERELGNALAVVLEHLPASDHLLINLRFHEPFHGGDVSRAAGRMFMGRGTFS